MEVFLLCTILTKLNDIGPGDNKIHWNRLFSLLCQISTSFNFQQLFPKLQVKSTPWPFKSFITTKHNTEERIAGVIDLDIKKKSGCFFLKW